MAKKKIVIEETVVEETVVKSSKDSVEVVWGNGSRVYSKEAHGAKFLDLAEQFISKFPGAKIV